MKPKVFVTQIPNRRDAESGKMKPTFDIMPAHEHGEVEVLMPATSSIFATADMVKQLRSRLVLYDYVRGDCIVPAGDPAIILAAGAILAEQHRKIRVLKWERNLRRYVSVEIAL